ncbi:histone-lysine N-methyltransferase SETMAR-like [Centruroides sculpturatus]|uniref:histone-lysine N-methyltransferase SETMAR-like n=1 Tax=Centruroides sculpturatus TaxID=218467 RepID=UPI000C6D1722|nr:histone-lysine N-methyltransferase SETMAR-like [Centruroides sculpturatus]
MNIDNAYKRAVLYFFFLSGETARSAAIKINSVHGAHTISVRSAQKWFEKFKLGKSNINDKPRSGCPVDFDNDVLKNLVESEPYLTVDQIAEKMHSSHGTVFRHLKEIGKVSKLGKWVPHDLSEANCQQRLNICISLLSRFEREPFLDRLVTGDEKWVIYDNVTRKRQRTDKDKQPISTPKASLHPKKVLLSVWWDMYGVIYYELLEPNKTINADVYSEQLCRLNSELIKKRSRLVNMKKVLFHHDNARQHMARKTLQKINELNWELLPHPAYSPDIASSDFQLFRALQNFCQSKNFNSKQDIQNELRSFFASKQQSFYASKIKKLPERWRDIVDSGGKYIID